MLDCRLLTNEAEVHAIAPQWRDLHKRVGTRPFSDFDYVHLWWELIGNPDGASLHIVTGWMNEELVALLPLAIYHRGGLRLARWACHDVFFGNLGLYERDAMACDLWLASRHSGLYDIAEIKYLTPGTPEHDTISEMTCARCVHRDVELFSQHTPSSSYKNASSPAAHMRKRYKRRFNKTKEKGNVECKTQIGQPFPATTIDQIIAQKKTWAATHNKNSALFETDDFLKRLAKLANDRNQLVTLSLQAGDDLVSGSLNFIHGKAVYGYMISVNQAWKDYAPGILLTLHRLEWSMDNAFDTFSFMEGQEEHKKRLATGSKAIETFVYCATPKGLLGMLYYLSKRLLRK